MRLHFLAGILSLLVAAPSLAATTNVTVTSGSAVEITLTVPAGTPVATISITVNVVQASPTQAAPPGPAVPPAPAPVVVTPSSQGWTPPIGIPEPSFGIREVAPARPSPWTAETPLWYYVDQKSTAASDQRTFGTPGAPRKTIPIALPAGAVVELHGTYDYAPMGYSSVIGDGAPARPIFIRGQSQALRPTIKRELHILGSYVILENLAFADLDGDLSGQPVLLAPAHHVAIRDCDISGNLKRGGLLVVSWDGSRGHDLVVLRCSIHDCGDWRATFDQDQHGIGLGNVDTCWILDCEMTHCSGDGIQINAGSLANQPRTHHIFVGRNRSHHNKQSGMWTKQALDVIFSQNTVYAHRPSDSSPGGGMGFQYAPERVWFLWNDVSDCDIGIYTGSDSGLGSGTEAFAIGNRLHGIHRSKPVAAESGWAPAAMTLAGGRGWWIAGNAVDDADAGIYSPNAAATFRLDGNALTRVAHAPVLVEGGKVINDAGSLPALRARFQALYGVALP